MKTFTVRELDRQPAVVLDAADRDGVVQIKRRNGRVYSLQPTVESRTITSLPDFAARRKRIFGTAAPIFTKTQARLFDQFIAGE